MKPLPEIHRDGISKAKFIVSWSVITVTFLFLGYMALVTR